MQTRVSCINPSEDFALVLSAVSTWCMYMDTRLDQSTRIFVFQNSEMSYGGAWVLRASMFVITDVLFFYMILYLTYLLLMRRPPTVTPLFPHPTLFMSI